MVDSNGNITEGSLSNIFFIKGSTVYTAPIESVLPGITRKYVVHSCENLNINVVEQYIHFTKLKEFDSAFITSTSSNVLPVSDIENTTFNSNHPILRKIMVEFDKVISTYLKNFKE